MYSGEKGNSDKTTQILKNYKVWNLIAVIYKSLKSTHLRMIGISFSAQTFCNERDLETQQNASVCRCSVFSFLLGTIVKFKVKDYYPVTQVSIFFGKKMEDA